MIADENDYPPTQSRSIFSRSPRSIVFAGAAYITIAASIGLSLITPAPAQAATAEEFLNLFDFLKKYVVDLDKLTNPAPAPEDPAPTVPDEPNSEELNWNN